MLLTKWWLIVKKQEMTRVWVGDSMVPVTLLCVVSQVVLRHKTVSVDGYSALVVGGDQKKSWEYAYVREYVVGDDMLSQYPVWVVIDVDILDGCDVVRFQWVSKWKWFQWWMKRYNFWWWPATHGSKFHRALWSTWNRKPRRTHKWKKMAGHMGSENITLKSVKVLEVSSVWEKSFVLIQWSVPGAYKTYASVLVC